MKEREEKIVRTKINKTMNGCDFFVLFPLKRKNEKRKNFFISPTSFLSCSKLHIPPRQQRMRQSEEQIKEDR